MTITNVGEYLEKLEHSYSAVEMWNGTATLENSQVVL